MAWSVAHYHGALFQLERECMVPPALALKHSRRPCEPLADAVADAGPAAACGGRADTGVAAVIADEFSVEDLLDLDGLEDFSELGEDAAPEQVHGAAEEKDKLASDSNGSAAVVSYEPMKLPFPQHMDDFPLADHDAEDLGWLACIIDDSLADLPPQTKLDEAALVAAALRPVDSAAAAPRTAMRRSPTKTTCAVSTEALVPVKAKRSKRSRACVSPLSGGAPLSEWATTSYCTSSWASGSPRLLRPLPDSSSLSFSSSHYFIHDETTCPGKKTSKHGDHCSNNGGKQKKRGSDTTKHHRGRTQFVGGAAASAYALVAQHVDRRCSHCGVKKTPQWRAGPEGAKTLCNACGVRYKSGRLFPEYRPACSPTFVSTIHSNFHRKVVAMRRQKEDGHGPGALPLTPVPATPRALIGQGPAGVSS